MFAEHPLVVAGDGLTDGQAFTVLLTVESFLLAVVALCVTLTQPDQKRTRALPVHAKTLATLAAILQSLCAFGALVALVGMLERGTETGFWDIVMIGCVLVAVVAQPIFGFLLAQGAKFR